MAGPRDLDGGVVNLSLWVLPTRPYPLSPGRVTFTPQSAIDESRDGSTVVLGFEMPSRPHHWETCLIPPLAGAFSY
jgi:hypothetical protein